MTATTTWPTCDARGCWEPAARDYEAARHFGPDARPVTLYLSDDSGPHHFCAIHLARVRGWLARRQS